MQACEIQGTKHNRYLLKIIQTHKSLPRLDRPTTQIIFLNDSGETLFREYYEESSKHFKTYATIGHFCLDTRNMESSMANKRPLTGVKLLDLFGGKVLEAQIISKAWTKEIMAQHISCFFKSIGIIEFSNLIILISPSDRKDYSSLARYFCQIANDLEVRTILALKYNISIPEKTIFIAGLHDHGKARVNITKNQELTGDHKILLNYFGQKTDWVMERYSTFHAETLEDNDRRGNRMLIVIGRRLITRGLYLNDEAFLQSYDYTLDTDCVYLAEIFKSFLDFHVSKNTKEFNPLKSMFLIEHFPTSIEGLISRNSHIRATLEKNGFKLGTIHPETREVNFFVNKYSPEIPGDI